jgi:uncharacterized membrane protein YeaQ/YmgE (transglycosylase-associated protein family)
MENIIKIYLSAASITIGAILGILRSKIFASKHATKLHWFFYVLSLVVGVGSLVGSIIWGTAIFTEANYFASFVLVIAFIASIILFIITKKFLLVKDTFSTPELDPIVNTFTSNADSSDIKLFGGDLNFFGENPSQIDRNKQYTHLRSLGFRRVLILCETPANSTQKIRYGKILSELQGSELRFYNPESADLKVRGRIIRVNGVSKLLMYTKINRVSTRQLKQIRRTQMGLCITIYGS